MALDVETLVVGPLQCNCRILICSKTQEAAVIDPGDEAEKIVGHLRTRGLKPKYLLHTHAHFDHFGATSQVRDAFEATIAVHRGDQWLYENLPLQGRLFGFPFAPPKPIEKFLEDEEVLRIGEVELQVTHTPGHSPGSVCFCAQEADSKILFSGDTLFRRSIGRADLWGGDPGQLIRSIQRRLLPLDPETRVLPGHGESTTIGEEKAQNPFLI